MSHGDALCPQTDLGGSSWGSIEPSEQGGSEELMLNSPAGVLQRCFSQRDGDKPVPPTQLRQGGRSLPASSSDFSPVPQFPQLWSSGLSPVCPTASVQTQFLPSTLFIPDPKPPCALPSRRDGVDPAARPAPAALPLGALRAALTPEHRADPLGTPLAGRVPKTGGTT